jgi:hypothetical protein
MIRKALINNWLFIAIVLLFSPVNTILESLKWHQSTRHLGQTFKQSIASVYVGMSAGILTPMRLGEYLGRLVFIPSQKYINALSANLYCSIAQNMINIIIGSAIILLSKTDEIRDLGFYAPSILIFYAFVITLSIFFYFNASLIFQKMEDYFPKLQPYFEEDLQPSAHDLTMILIWSLVRYGVYFIQYVGIIYSLNIEVTMWNAFVAIGVTFLIQTALVLPPVVSMMARIQIAILVWQGIGVTSSHVIVAALIIWVVNIAIPALIGNFVLFRSSVTNKINVNV